MTEQDLTNLRISSIQEYDTLFAMLVSGLFRWQSQSATLVLHKSVQHLLDFHEILFRHLV